MKGYLRIGPGDRSAGPTKELYISPFKIEGDTTHIECVQPASLFRPSQLTIHGDIEHLDVTRIAVGPEEQLVSPVPAKFFSHLAMPMNIVLPTCGTDKIIRIVFRNYSPEAIDIAAYFTGTWAGL